MNASVKYYIKVSVCVLLLATVITPSARAQYNYPMSLADYLVQSRRQPALAVKTNLLFDLVSALNLEVEVPLHERWSVLVEGIFPWWIWEHKRYCFEVVNVNLEGRYWLSHPAYRPELAGWFAGVYAGGGYYDIEMDDKGYQGEFYLSAGLTGGYAHTLGRSSDFRMEYSVGVGYFNTHYREYSSVWGADNEWHQIYRRSGDYRWIGLTRLKVSLVWMLNF